MVLLFALCMTIELSDLMTAILLSWFNLKGCHQFAQVHSLHTLAIICSVVLDNFVPPIKQWNASVIFAIAFPVLTVIPCRLQPMSLDLGALLWLKWYVESWKRTVCTDQVVRTVAVIWYSTHPVHLYGILIITSKWLIIYRSCLL